MFTDARLRRLNPWRASFLASGRNSVRLPACAIRHDTARECEGPRERVGKQAVGIADGEQPRLASPRNAPPRRKDLGASARSPEDYGLRRGTRGAGRRRCSSGSAVVRERKPERGPLAHHHRDRRGVGVGVGYSSRGHHA